MRSHTADPVSLAQSKEAAHPSLTRQTGRTSLPGPGHHPGQRSGHPQQGMPQHPQQGHHMQGPPPYREPKHGVPPGQSNSSKGSRIPSLFDLPDSPEKKGGSNSMPPGYPGTGLPPPYPEASRPSGIPAQPLFPTNPLSPGFERHTKPRPPELPRGSSLEPGELLDTPTPTHIKNMVQGFPFPKGHQQPGVPPGFPKMEKPDQLNTSLPTFPTAIEQAAPTSKLQQSLFDPDYDDFGDSTFNLGDLLTNSLADPKEETSKPRAPAENFTATCDLSALFDDQDSSQMSGGFGNFGNPGAPGAGFKQEQQAGFVKQEKGQETARAKTESDNRLSSSSRLPSSPYKPVKKESEAKRRSSEKTSSASSSEVKKEKKSGLGGLFSPESDSRPPALPPHSSSGNNQRLPGAPADARVAAPTQAATSDPLRTSSNSLNQQQQQVRPTSTGGDASADPVVNVQKLESIAPEFQQMLKEAPPSSILVTPDGQPSPRKREEERRKEQERRRGEEKEKSHDKRRTTSGHSSSHNSSTQRGSSQPSDKAPSNHERSDKTASNHEKSSASSHEKAPSASSHRPGPASVSRGNGERASSGNPSNLPSGGQPANLVDPSLQQTNMQQPSSGEKEHKKEKHKHKKEKKEKKDKKEKKEKRDKDEGSSEVKSEKERETGGGDHKKHKKDKKKHKERERSREKDAKTPSLKIKMAGGTPSMSPSKGEGDMLAPIPKITLKLGGTVTKVTGQQEAGSTPASKSHHSSGSSSSSSSSHKRKAPPSTTRLDGPAAKMARAIGTDPGKEAKFLETTDLMRKSSSSHESKKVKVSSNKGSHD